MRAVVRDRYGSSDVLRLEEIDPPTPAAGEAVVRVAAASLNTADLDHLRGLPRFARVWYGIRRPRIRGVGLDVAGRVEAVGHGVEGLAVGDDVWADLFDHGQGALAELVSAPASAFTPKPTSTTFEEAATVPHSGVLAVQGLLCKGPITPGSRVLVNGAGGCVGPFAVQVAKASGAEVTAVDHGDKLEYLRSLGADHVVDYTRQDVTRNGERYDLILDIAQNRSVLQYRRSLRPGGRYMLIARTLGGFGAAAILGGIVTVLGDKRMGIFMWRPNRRSDLDLLRDLLDSGRIRPLVDRSFPLEETVDAFRHLESGEARGKVVVVP